MNSKIKHATSRKEKLSVKNRKTPTAELLEMIRRHPIKNVKRPEEDII